jgi:CMP/dCMP kinase
VNIPDDVIIIFGFSGSGKSTLANLIAPRYGLRIIHPSGVLRDLIEGRSVDLENTRHNTGFWESEEGVRIFEGRLGEEEPLDVKADKIILGEVEKGHVVIDSWSLPWLTGKGLKIYLAAELPVRAGRVVKRSGITYERARDVVAMKDEETRKLFVRLYGFDIKKDHERFDYVVHTDMLSREQVFEKLCEFIG